MPGMKVTLDAAMRARDVSRPHAEHEDQAVASEPQYARARDQGQDTRDTRGTQPAASAPADTAAGVAARPAGGGAARGRSPRRRRRRR
jgi:hypothetical protein